MSEKSYDKLEFSDDFLFCHILMEREDICIELTEMITGRKIKEILHSEGQKSIKMTYDGKGVRFDVYFEDNEGVVYDIEMQTVRKYNLPQRARYYQGMIDLNILSKGEGFETLMDSYIIFICTFDEFGLGRHRYTFEDVCIEDPKLRLGDGARKIFLCAGGSMDDCSEDMKDFLDYIAGKETSGRFSRRLREEVERSRVRRKWRLDYMTLLEKYKEKYEEGRTEGEERYLIKQVCRKLRRGIAPEQISDELEEDEIRIKAICEVAGWFAPDYDEEKVIEAVLTRKIR